MESPEVLDVSKENIQPLRQGRNALQLSAALQAQTDTTILQNLVKKRQEYELLLRTYDGDDPLSIWFEYVEWVEQSFPKDGKEGNLMTLLQNCLTRFKDSMEYFQDIRLVKLWIKYMEKLENPLELYSQLHCHGIGSQCALFYKCWAYELYENDDFKQADKVLRTGIGRNAQPIDELIRAHQNFQTAVARRILDESLPARNENAMEEERKVGNVLTTFGKKHKVPSVRIGGRVKSNFPGTLHSKENLPQKNLDHVNIYEAENDPGIARSTNKMQTVPHLEILKKENTKKPTPWSGIKQKSTHQFHPPKPSFQVLSDENAQPEPSNTVMFLNALKPKKKDDGFNCPIAIFEVPNPNQQPRYPKDQVYAGGTEYSLEELRAVRYMKRKDRRNKELSVPGSQDPVQMEVTLCTPPHSAGLETLNPLTMCVSESSSVSTSKKESNSDSYTENCMFHHKQELSALGNNYEKCTRTDISSTVGNYYSLGDIKLPEQPSVAKTQYQHCVEDSKYRDSAANNVAEMDNLCVFGSRDLLTPVVEQRVVDGNCVPENVKYAYVFTSLSKEDIRSENTDTILSSNRQSSCTPPLLLAENEQQKQKKMNSPDTFPVKGSGFSVFTTNDSVSPPETVKAGAFLTSLNREDMSCSENTDTMLSSNKQTSHTPTLFLAENKQQKMNNQSAFPVKGSGFSVFTTDDDIGASETIKADVSTSLNKEEITHPENADIMLASNKASSCTHALSENENEQQKQISQGKSSLKSSGFSMFTTDAGIGTSESVKASGFSISLHKEDIPYSENSGITLLSTKPSSCAQSLSLAENEQQKLHNHGKFSVKDSDFSVLTTGGGTCAPETVKAGDIFTYSRTEEVVSHLDHINTVLLSNKVEGVSRPVLMQGNENEQYGEIQEGKISVNGNRIPEFPIFSDEENCYAKGRVGLVKTEQENGFSGLPNKNKNVFSHSVICGPNELLHGDGRFFSSTTKKNKVAPFQLFVDEGEVPEGNEPCAIKRELFKVVAREHSDKLCDVNSKENIALPSTHTSTNRPIVEKREIKVCDNVITSSMLKLKQKRATEPIKEPCAEDCERVTSATALPKKSEGCVPSSISASSEEVLKVINECWASPPKSKKDAGNGLWPELHKQPEDRDFQHNSPLKPSAALTGELGLFPDNKENALPQCTKQNVEPANTSVNDDWFLGQLGEPRALDDTSCTLMFSKTLISSTPNRKSGGPLSSDSSDTSPPDSQEFKIPRRCTSLQAERHSVMPRPEPLSVIMESSKENKSQSSSGSSSGGRTAHRTAFSLVSPQTENTHSALEMQAPCEAHAVIMARSLSPHDEGDSSI